LKESGDKNNLQLPIEKQTKKYWENNFLEMLCGA
jgi:hypothetical protein